MVLVDLNSSLPDDLWEGRHFSWICDSFNTQMSTTWAPPSTNQPRDNNEQRLRGHMSPVFGSHWNQMDSNRSFGQLPQLPLDPLNPTMPISRSQLLTPSLLQGFYSPLAQQSRSRVYSDSSSQMPVGFQRRGGSFRNRANSNAVEYGRMQQPREFRPFPETAPSSSGGARSRRTSRLNSSGSDNECDYCHNLQLDFHGHTKYNCPVLASLAPCNICGAEGFDNHTATHCPYAEKTVLQLRPEFANRRRYDYNDHNKHDNAYNN